MDAYALAVQQFQDCLHTYGGDGFDDQAIQWCGYAAGSAYGAWSALATIHAWQLVAALGWAVAAALAITAGCLYWRQRRWRAY